MNEQEMNDVMDVFEGKVEPMTAMEKKAMNEIDELVEVFHQRSTRAKMMAREHERMLKMVRDQEEKIMVLKMRQEHVNALLAGLEGKLHAAKNEEEAYCFKDQCAALMKELRHLQHGMERSQMMLARFKNEAQARELDLQSINRSQERAIEKAQNHQAANATLIKNDEQPRDGMHHVDTEVRSEILAKLQAKLEEMDTQAIHNLLLMTQKAESTQSFVYGVDTALLAIKPKVTLIRESNLYSLLTNVQKLRIDDMIAHFEKRIQSCEDPKILAVFVEDFHKTAFPRIFRKMAEAIE